MTGILIEGRREWVGSVLGKSGTTCNLRRGQARNRTERECLKQHENRVPAEALGCGRSHTKQSRRSQVQLSVNKFCLAQTLDTERRENFSILPDPRIG